MSEKKTPEIQTIPLPEHLKNEPPPPPKPKKPTSPLLIKSLLELTILVVGILLSLWINDLMQDRKDNQRADVYLRRLHQDLNDDLDQLERGLKDRTNQLESTRTMLAAMNKNDPKELPIALMEGFQNLLWTRRFAPKDATFRSLESTGELRLIHNDSLVNELLYLYRGAYGILNENNDDLTKYRDNFLLPYVIKNISFRQAFNPSVAAGPPKVNNKEELYNHLIYESISMSSTVESYNYNKGRVTELMDMIGRELAR